MRLGVAVLVCAMGLFSAAAQETAPDDAPAEERPGPYFHAPLVLPNIADAIGYPQAVTADPVTGEVFVCDARGNRVIIFDDEALFEYQIVGGDLFSSPTDIAIDPDGILVLLANYKQRRSILELDYDGLFLDEIRLSGKETAVENPGFSSLALSASGQRLFVLDQANLTLWIADRSGKLRGSVDLAEGLTERERQDMILSKVDVFGDRVLVVIPSRSLIRIFDLDGNPVQNTGIKGTAPCQIGFPMAAALDVEGKLLVVDQQRMYLLRWDPELNACMGEYSGPGTVDGYLYYPLDLAVDPQGRVYVSQGYEGRLHAFGGFPPAVHEGFHPEAKVPVGGEAREYEPRYISPEDEIADMVRGWHRARIELILDEYVSYYSDDFQPADLPDREAWEKTQRVEMEWTDLRISGIEVTLIRDGIARVHFVETHRSDAERPPLRKTLLVRREQDGWKILEERATPLSAASDPPAPPSEE